MNRCTSCSPTPAIVGVDPPRLTKAQLETPSIERALEHTALGGFLLGAGAVGAVMFYGRGFGGNMRATGALAAAALGAVLLFTSRRSEG